MDAVPEPSTSLFPLQRPLIWMTRYSWLFILTLITEFIFYTFNWFPKYTRLYQSIIRKIVDWENYKTFRRVLSRISLFAVPFLLETCFIWSLPWLKLLIIIARKLSLFVVMYSWSLLIICASEVLEKNNILSKYIRIYRSIMNKLNHWTKCSEITLVTICILIFSMPTLAKQVKNRSITNQDVLTYMGLMFSIVFRQFVSSIFKSIFTNIIHMNVLQSIEIYIEPILNNFRPAMNYSTMKFFMYVGGIFTIPKVYKQIETVSAPMQTVLVCILIILISSIVYYSWLILLATINAHTSQSTIYSEYRLIFDKFSRWAQHNDIGSVAFIIGIFAFPALCEHIKIHSISIRERFDWILIKFVFFIIRNYWLTLIVIISEFLQENFMYEKTTRKHQALMDKKNCWPYRNTTEFANVVVITLALPPLLEHFEVGFISFRAIFTFILTIIVPIIIRYFWLILIIGMGEFCKDKKIFPRFGRIYKSVMHIIDQNFENNDFNNLILVGILFAIPPLCEHVKIRSISIRELFTIPLYILTVYIIRYFWLILIIMIGLYLEKNILSPTCIKTIEKEWNNSIDYHNLKFNFVFNGFLVMPLVFELVQWQSAFIKILFTNTLPSLIFFIIRYFWLILLISISKSFKRNDLFPKYVEVYEAITRRLDSWIEERHLSNRAVTVGILVGPLILDMNVVLFFTLTKLFLIFLWKSISFIFCYCWLLLLVIISETLKKNHISPRYLQLYRPIRRKVYRWMMIDDFRYGLVIVGILAGPFIVGKMITLALIITKLILNLLWKLCLFSIRYLWLLILVIIGEILEENQPNGIYERNYRRIKRKINRWIDRDNFKFGIVIGLVLTGSYLLEICLLNILIPTIAKIFSFLRMITPYFLTAGIVWFTFRWTSRR